MVIVRRRQYVTAEVACIGSVLLVLGVLYHVSGLRQGDVAESRVAASASSTKGAHVGSSRKLADKSCQHWNDVSLPKLDARHKGAVADIKRMTADYAHITAYVQSCEFQSRQLSNKTQKTRGIVIPSAGHTMFAHTWVVVTILREALGCTLPIEVIYNGKEEFDNNLALRLEVSQTLLALTMPTKHCTLKLHTVQH